MTPAPPPTPEQIEALIRPYIPTRHGACPRCGASVLTRGPSCDCDQIDAALRSYADLLRKAPASPTALSEVLDEDRQVLGRLLCELDALQDTYQAEAMALRRLLSALDALARDWQDTLTQLRDLRWEQKKRAEADADLAALRLRLTEAEQREQALRDAWTPLLEFAEQNLSTLRNGTGPSPNSAFIAMRYNANRALAARPVPPAHEDDCACRDCEREAAERRHATQERCREEGIS